MLKAIDLAAQCGQFPARTAGILAANNLAKIATKEAFSPLCESLDKWNKNPAKDEPFNESDRTTPAGYGKWTFGLALCRAIAANRDVL